MFCTKKFLSILLLLILPTISFAIQIFSSSSVDEQPHHQAPQAFGGTSRLNPFIWRAWKRGGLDAGGQRPQQSFGGSRRLNPFIWRAWKKRGMSESDGAMRWSEAPMDLGILFGKRQGPFGANGYVWNSAALTDKLADLAIGFGKRSEGGEEPRTIWQLSFH